MAAGVPAVFVAERLTGVALRCVAVVLGRVVFFRSGFGGRRRALVADFFVLARAIL
jgi:hypothetical protein